MVLPYPFFFLKKYFTCLSFDSQLSQLPNFFFFLKDKKEKKNDVRHTQICVILFFVSNKTLKKKK